MTANIHVLDRAALLRETWPLILDAAATMEETTFTDPRGFEVVIEPVGARASVVSSFRRAAAEYFANPGASANDKAALRADLAEMRHGLRGNYSSRGEAMPFFYSPPELIRPSIERVLADHPQLNAHGFGGYRPTDDLLALRDATYTDAHCQEFERALEWLMLFVPTPTLNRTASSYALKHEAERWLRANFDGHAYVSNGMLIIAALHLGMRVERVEHNGRDTPNAHLNLPSGRLGETDTRAGRRGRFPRR